VNFGSGSLRSALMPAPCEMSFDWDQRSTASGDSASAFVDDILVITLHLARYVSSRAIPRRWLAGELAAWHSQATQDVDLVIAITQQDVAAFVDALRGDFYLDEDAIRAAIHGEAASTWCTSVLLQSRRVRGEGRRASRLQMSRGVDMRWATTPPVGLSWRVRRT
jgi:hypothetical protein